MGSFESRDERRLRGNEQFVESAFQPKLTFKSSKFDNKNGEEKKWSQKKCR